MIGMPSLLGSPSGVALAVSLSAARASVAAIAAGGVTPTPSPTPTPSSPLAYTVDPTKRMIAGSGFQLPNKDGSIGAGFTQYSQYATYPGGLDWATPTGGSIQFLFANFMVHEASSTVNEDMNMTSDVLMRVLYMYYTDTAGTARTVKAELSDGGMFRYNVNNGGVRATFTLPAPMAKRAGYTLGLGLQVADGARMPNMGGLSFAGDVAKKHAVDNFDAVLAAKGNLVFTGSNGVATATASWSGGYIHPAAVLATGNDGRACLFAFGDSHLYGKATSYTNVAAQRRMGLLEHGMYATSNGYGIPVANMSIAGSGSTTNDDVIRKNTRALWDAAIADNGGYVPWTHYATNEGTNSLQGTTQSQVDMINARNNWWKAWRNKPVIQLTMIQKATSTDGFRTLANQVLNGSDASGGVRFNYNDALMAGGVSSAAYAVNVTQALQYDSANRDRFAIRPFTAQLSRDVAAGAASLYLNASPAIGEALALDPLSGTAQSRIVISSTETAAGSGEFLVVTETGSSAGTYPAKATGTLVGAHLTGDGQSAVVGLHVTYIGHIAMVPFYTDLKTALKAAGPGGFTA